MAKIHNGFTKTYPRNTTTKGLLYTFSLCENIKTIFLLTNFLFHLSSCHFSRKNTNYLYPKQLVNLRYLYSVDAGFTLYTVGKFLFAIKRRISCAYQAIHLLMALLNCSD